MDATDPFDPECAVTETAEDEIAANSAITAHWQTLMNQGRQHLDRRRLELSLQASPAHCIYRKYRVLGDLGWVNRLCGRYAKPLKILQEAIALTDKIPGPPTRPRVFIAGEVGTVYRQMDRLDEPRKAYADQYAMAKQIEDGDDAARKNEAEVLIQMAMQQLEESSQLATKIKKSQSDFRGHRPTTTFREAVASECMAYGRLSLCYATLASMDRELESRNEMFDKAAELSGKAVQSAVHMSSMWSSILPMCQFFRGHIYLVLGLKQLALEQFNPWRLLGPDSGVTTAAMALCREPSREHRKYLREVIAAGADLDISDPEGYTALDHAVFSGDAETEEIVLEGFRRQLRLSERDLAELQTEARLRKGYREILQEKLRPVLYERHKDDDCLKNVRRAYAKTLASDPEMSRLFDHLKFIRYTDVKRFGRLPRSSDGLAQSFGPELRGDNDGDDNNPDALVFFSYRWINQDADRNTPDDANHTQYRRMIDAAELFLQRNPSVKAEKLCIWMDFACVDQDDPGPGLSALPIIVIQCDAVVSLVDDTYYERVWCCVEAMMIYKLTYPSVYGQRWYEHVHASAATDPDQSDGGVGEWILQRGRRVPLSLRDKKLTYERDRPKVMFLQRQSRLLQMVAIGG
ncbi:hypothetical protein C8A03DRAFT_39583, partial [Achaetomium macrosporum]